MNRNRHGIFLYYPGAAYLDLYAQVLEKIDLEPYWGHIAAQPTTFEVVANLIPSAFQNGAESWLLLYRQNVEQECLVLPFPIVSELRDTNDGKQVEAKLRSLMETIATPKKWYPRLGYQNLQRNLEREFEEVWKRPYAERFQVIHLDRPLTQYLQEPEISSVPLHEQGLTTLFSQYNERLQLHRNEYLETLVEASQPHQDALITFESNIQREANDLMNRLSTEFARVPITPSIVNLFHSVLDEETKKFLVTVETIGHYAKSYASEQFDFTFAACGLWKAVERELNLSLVWYLRWDKQIGSSEHPLDFIEIEEDEPRPDPVSGVNIWVRDKEEPAKYAGIMFGNIKNILQGAKRRRTWHGLSGIVRDELLDRSAAGFLEHLSDIVKIRNRYSHITAMPFDKYEHMYDLVMKGDGQRSAMLYRVMHIKKEITQKIKGNSYA